MSNNEFDFEELDYGDLGDIDTSDFDLEQFERELGLLSDEPRNGETSGQDAKPKPDSIVAKADNSKNDDNNNTKHESDASSDEHLVAIEASKQESIAKANDGDKPVVEEASSTVTKKTDVQQASDKLATNDGKEQGKSNENSLDTKTEEAKAHGDKHTLRNQSTDTKTHKATGNTHGKRPGYQRSIGYQHLQMNPYMAATNMAMPGYLPFYSFAMPQMMMYPPQTGSRVYVNPKFAQSSQFASQELSAPPAGLSPELLRLREQIAATRRRKLAAKANAQGDGINISKASDSQTSSQVSTNGRKRNSGDDAIEVRSNKRPNTSSAPTNSATSHTPYQGIKIKGAATANRENTTNNTSMQTSSSGIHKQVNNDPAPTSSRITIKGRNAANREQSANISILDRLSLSSPLSSSSPSNQRYHDNSSATKSTEVTIRGRGSNKEHSMNASILDRLSSSSPSNSSSSRVPNRNDDSPVAGNKGMTIKGCASANREHSILNRISASPQANASSPNNRNRRNNGPATGSLGITITGSANIKKNANNTSVFSRLSTSQHSNTSSPSVFDRLNSPAAGSSSTQRNTAEARRSPVYNFLMSGRGVKRSQEFEETNASHKRTNIRSIQYRRQ